MVAKPTVSPFSVQRYKQGWGFHGKLPNLNREHNSNTCLHEGLVLYPARGVTGCGIDTVDDINPT